MSGAGDFRTRLLLQSPVENDDGQGGVVRSYVDAQKIWARVTPLAVRDGVVADAAGAAMPFRIDTRAPLSLSLRHRLVDGDTIYRLRAFRSDGRTVTIDAEAWLM